MANSKFGKVLDVFVQENPQYNFHKKQQTDQTQTMHNLKDWLMSSISSIRQLLKSVIMDANMSKTKKILIVTSVVMLIMPLELIPVVGELADYISIGIMALMFADEMHTRLHRA